MQNVAMLHQLHIGFHIYMNINSKALDFVLLFVYWERTWVEFMRFALLTVVSVKTEPCSSVDNYQCCRGICCLYLQGRRMKMEVADSCDTLVRIYWMTWNYIPRGPSLMSEFVSSFSLIGCVHLGHLVCHDMSQGIPVDLWICFKLFCPHPHKILTW